MGRRESPQEFIGRLFGKEQQLTVIGLGSRQGERNNKQMYRVHCSVCSQDSELFGDGVFEMTKGNLLKGAIPCGCARNPRWSEQQNIVRVKRKLSGTDAEFVSLAEPYKGADTRLTLLCKKHNVTWSITSFHTLLGKRSRGVCIECEREIISERKTEDEDAVIASIAATGMFPEGSTFWRTPVKRFDSSQAAAGNQWAMLCGKCSYDEYVEEGLCDGVFTALISDLKKGRRPCRCSGHFRYTLAQREFQIKKQASLTDGIDFLNLKYTSKGLKHPSKLMFWAKCDTHGEFESSVNHMDRRGITCPKCAVSGFKTNKDGYVYVLKVDGISGSFTGYGISNVPDKRFKDHTKNLQSHGLTIIDSEVFKFSGDVARTLEKEIQSMFPLHVQDIDGFKTEATYSSLYPQVASFVRERHAEYCA